MSGATTMYALKPIVYLPGEIKQPESMYKLNNIHGERRSSDHVRHESKIVSDITEQVIKFLKSPLPEVAALEIRQEKILTQLAQLKEQVSSLCGILKGSSKTKQAVVCANQERVSADLVVNVNPSRIPFSILALQRIWTDTDIKVTSHIHSSVTVPPPQFLASTKPCSSHHTINLSLIWKTVEDLQLVVSGVHGYPLLGEVNLLRYLSRLIVSHSYESSTCTKESSKIDGILDLCHQLSHQESPKERQAAISTLGSKLGKEQWLLGRKEPSIADIAAWSIIKQLSFGKLPSNVASWVERCDTEFLN